MYDMWGFPPKLHPGKPVEDWRLVPATECFRFQILGSSDQQLRLFKSSAGENYLSNIVNNCVFATIVCVWKTAEDDKTGQPPCNLSSS